MPQHRRATPFFAGYLDDGTVYYIINHETFEHACTAVTLFHTHSTRTVNAARLLLVSIYAGLTGVTSGNDADV